MILKLRNNRPTGNIAHFSRNSYNLSEKRRPSYQIQNNLKEYILFIKIHFFSKHVLNLNILSSFSLFILILTFSLPTPLQFWPLWWPYHTLKDHDINKTRIYSTRNASTQSKDFLANWFLRSWFLSVYYNVKNNVKFLPLPFKLWFQPTPRNHYMNKSECTLPTNAFTIQIFQTNSFGVKMF